MKVRLMNHGGYESLICVDFPVEVEASYGEDETIVNVTGLELISIGGDYELLSGVKSRVFVDDDFEVVE